MKPEHADELAQMPTNLELKEAGREAMCLFCGSLRYSHNSLPQYRHRPYVRYDTFDCGCRAAKIFGYAERSEK